VQSLSPFTLGSFSSLNPLPINLLELKTECNFNATKILWKTADETDVENFIIEKWVNSGFIEIGIVKSNNSKTSINHYSFKDIGIQNDFIYRLNEELYDGTRHLIREFQADCKTNQKQKVSLIQKGQEIEINSTDYRGKLNFQLINNLGQIIHTDSFYKNTIINTQFLNSGIYVLNIPELQLSFKIIL
jgi:hypothetical protein